MSSGRHQGTDQGLQTTPNSPGETVDRHPKKGKDPCRGNGFTKRRMNTLEIGIYACFWNNILQRANATSKKLQTVKLDLNSAVASLHSLREYIKDKRGEFQVFEREGEELTGATYQVERQSRRKDDIVLKELLLDYIK